jgi:hypothetical protein
MRPTPVNIGYKLTNNYGFAYIGTILIDTNGTKEHLGIINYYASKYLKKKGMLWNKQYPHYGAEYLKKQATRLLLWAVFSEIFSEGVLSGASWCANAI